MLRIGKRLDDLRGSRPEADGAHHVLADTEPDRGVGGGEDLISVADPDYRLAEPAVTGMEGLVTGENRSGCLCDPEATHATNWAIAAVSARIRPTT